MTVPGRADPKMAAVVVAPEIGAEPNSRLGNCRHNVTNDRPNPGENESTVVMSVQSGPHFPWKTRTREKTYCRTSVPVQVV